MRLNTSHCLCRCLLGMTLLTGFVEGGDMAGQMSDFFPEGWVTVKDEAVGIKADFPHRPIEMSFDIPFQNTPPTGRVHLYSVPTRSGVLVLSSLTSKEGAEVWLEKEQLHRFFDTILVPHLFFNPKIFNQEQAFGYSLHQEDKHLASFYFTFQDHGITKRLEGFAHARGEALYLYFYLGSENEFDRELLKHFSDSVHTIDE